MPIWKLYYFGKYLEHVIMSDRIFAKIKLPGLYKFRGNKKNEVSPYEKFHLWVADQFGGVPNNRTININASWLHHSDADELTKLTKAWAKSKLFPDYNKRFIDKEVSTLNMNIGPAEFDKEETVEYNIKRGYVYIRPNVFQKKRR